MKFLICLSGEGPFEGLVRLGGKISQAFGADLSVLFIESNVRASRREEILLVQDKMSQWNLAHPGLAALSQAKDQLFAQGVIGRDQQGEPRLRHAIKPDIFGAFEMHLYGAADANIRFRLRLGDPLEEIKDEVERGRYDLAITDFKDNFNFTKNLIHFVSTSLLIVKNLKEINYRFLICVDPHKPHRRTELVGAKLAKFFRTPAIVLSVARHELRLPRTKNGVEHVERLLRKGQVQFEVRRTSGRVAQEVVSAAGDESIIVLAASRRNTLSQIFRGSIAQQVIKTARCPVLIVR